MYCRVIVELGNLLNKLSLGCGIGEMEKFADNAGLWCTVRVNNCSWIMPHTSSAAFNFMRTYVAADVRFCEAVLQLIFHVLESERSPTI